jgi:hypothetical protein
MHTHTHMHDLYTYVSGDDGGAPAGGPHREEDQEYRHPRTVPGPARQRTDPVRDIIVAQAAARQRQQQQLAELALPLSGAAIVPSYRDADAAAQRRPPPPPPLSPGLLDTMSTPVASRAPTPLLSSFQVSRATSPSASTHTNASVFDAEGEGDADGEYGGEVPRGKRSRPTARQLAALRALHAATASPTIAERTRVGSEIGMYVPPALVRARLVC